MGKPQTRRLGPGLSLVQEAYLWAFPFSNEVKSRSTKPRYKPLESSNGDVRGHTNNPECPPKNEALGML